MNSTASATTIAHYWSRQWWQRAHSVILSLVNIPDTHLLILRRRVYWGRESFYVTDDADGDSLLYMQVFIVMTSHLSLAKLEMLCWSLYSDISPLMSWRVIWPTFRSAVDEMLNVNKLRICCEILPSGILASRHRYLALFSPPFSFSTWTHKHVNQSSSRSNISPCGVTANLPENIGQCSLQRTLRSFGWWLHTIYSNVDIVTMGR